MDASWISLCLLLVLLIDPVGNIPFFLAALKPLTRQRRIMVILREAGFALGLLFIFLFFGREVLAVLGLSSTSLRLAGGVVLFLIALRMIFGPGDEVFGKLPAGEPFLVPLAVPLLAGPSALATTILLAASPGVSHLVAGSALVVAMALSAIILLLSERIVLLLGERGVEAFGRLMGLILTALAVEMFLRGVREFLQLHPA